RDLVLQFKFVLSGSRSTMRNTGQPDSKRRAFSLAGALGLYRASMDLHKMTDNSQTKTETAVGASCRSVGLLEPFENIRQEFGIDALSVIRHDDVNARLQPMRANFDSPTLGRKLDRVGQQIPDHLLQPFGIARNDSRSSIHVYNKVDVFCFCRRT